MNRIKVGLKDVDILLPIKESDTRIKKMTGKDDLMPKTVRATFFGKEAKEIAEAVGLENVDDYTDVNTKVFIRIESVEGRPKISIEFDI